MKNIVGINEFNMDKLILNIYNDSEKLNKILNKITEEINQAETELSGRAINIERRKINQQKEYYKTIKNRLHHLTGVLLKAKIGTVDFSAELKQILTEDADKLSVEYKPLVEEEK